MLTFDKKFGILNKSFARNNQCKQNVKNAKKSIDIDI